MPTGETPTRSWRTAAALLAGLLFLLLLAGAPAAGAAISPLAVSTLTPELEAAESGGGSKLSLSFTNVSDGPAILGVEAVGLPACKPTPAPGQLAPNQTTAVTLEIPAACTTSEGLKLEVSAALAGSTSQSFEIAPKGAAPKKPDWGQLWSFAIALAAALVLALAFFYFGWTPGEAGERKWGQALSSLDATWKFNDNWATNATAAGGLLTGLFGATTAKAFLGASAEGLTALATVGAAIALALVAAAPVAALALKSHAVSDGKRGDAFTPAGILAGAALVLAAGVAQLWVVARMASELEVGDGAKIAVWAAFGLAFLLLLVYSWRALKDVLERGTEKAAQDPEVEMKAAEVIARAIEAGASEGDKRETALAAVNHAIAAGQGAAAEGYRYRPRSALL